jgi:ribosomal protein S18 acetylase RimI-like enzyme
VEAVLRRAFAADADAIADVWLASYGATYGWPPVHSADQVRSWIRDVLLPEREMWVAQADGGLIVGLMALAPGDLDQLYVLPGWTGRGIGSRFVALAKERQPGGLTLFTFQVNAEARRFYERHGFRVVDTNDGERNEEHQPDVQYAWRPGPAS